MIIAPILSFVAGMWITWLYCEIKNPIKYNMNEYSKGFEDGFSLAEKIYQDQYSDKK